MESTKKPDFIEAHIGDFFLDGGVSDPSDTEGDALLADGMEIYRRVTDLLPIMPKALSFPDYGVLFGLGVSYSPSPKLYPVPAPPRRIRPPPTMAHGKLKHVVFKASCKRGTKGM